MSYGGPVRDHEIAVRVRSMVKGARPCLHTVLQLRKAARRAGRPVPRVRTEALALAEIDRLRQVAEVLGR